MPIPQNVLTDMLENVEPLDGPPWPHWIAGKPAMKVPLMRAQARQSYKRTSVLNICVDLSHSYRIELFLAVLF